MCSVNAGATYGWQTNGLLYMQVYPLQTVRVKVDDSTEPSLLIGVVMLK